MSVRSRRSWPAFWTLGTPFRGNYLNWPGVGEIDIMEDVNGAYTMDLDRSVPNVPGGALKVDHVAVYRR